MLTIMEAATLLGAEVGDGDGVSEAMSRQAAMLRKAEAMELGEGQRATDSSNSDKCHAI